MSLEICWVCCWSSLICSTICFRALDSDGHVSLLNFPVALVAQDLALGLQAVQLIRQTAIGDALDLRDRVLRSLSRKYSTAHRASICQGVVLRRPGWNARSHDHRADHRVDATSAATMRTGEPTAPTAVRSNEMPSQRHIM